MTVISEDAPVNIGATTWPDTDRAGVVVRQIQNKLHCWATADGSRRFDDLYNWLFRFKGGVGGLDRLRSAAF